MNLLQQTVKDALAQQIRAEIIRGDLPPGKRLRLRDLAAQYHISTMPVRQALHTLESEGLVSGEPHKGCYVTRLTPEELQDIYDVRATLESMAARLAVPNLSHAALDLMHDLVEQMDRCPRDIVQLVDLNFRYHMTLYAASGRQHLCGLIEILRHRTEHYLHAYAIQQQGMPLAQDEHRAIILACKQQDAARVEALMYQHVHKAGQGIIAHAQVTHLNR